MNDYLGTPVSSRRTFPKRSRRPVVGPYSTRTDPIYDRHRPPRFHDSRNTRYTPQSRLSNASSLLDRSAYVNPPVRNYPYKKDTSFWMRQHYPIDGDFDPTVRRERVREKLRHFNPGHDPVARSGTPDSLVPLEGSELTVPASRVAMLTADTSRSKFPPATPESVLPHDGSNIVKGRLSTAVQRLRKKHDNERYRKKEFVPHWGFYVETPPSPAQSVKPRQGSVLLKSYKRGTLPLTRHILSPKSVSKSMHADHGSTLTTPSQKGEKYPPTEPEQSVIAPPNKYHNPPRGYGNTRVHNYNPQGGHNYGNPQRSDYGRQGHQYTRQDNHQRPNGYNKPSKGSRPVTIKTGGYTKYTKSNFYDEKVEYESERKNNFWRRTVSSPDGTYICSLSGILKLIEFIVSLIIIILSQVDGSLWSSSIYVTLVGVAGLILAVLSCFFRLFRLHEIAHPFFLWFEFVMYILVTIFMAVAAVLATLQANTATSVVATTFFCFVGAGVFFADTILIGLSIRDRYSKTEDKQQSSGNRNEQEGSVNRNRSERGDNPRQNRSVRGDGVRRYGSERGDNFRRNN